MSSLHVTTWSMPSAHLGSENALPALGGGRNIGTSLAQPEQQSIDYPDKGRENDPLPYRMQDAWDRSRQPRTFKAIVLENKHLKATFLPELAGRLWSLVHKPANRELLFPNPVVQPGNLAVRGAWLAGGVEWNISIFGHTPLTLEPFFAAEVQADDGTPVLRLWEFERIRRVVFQIDCWLPSRSPFLLTRVRIINPHDHIIPMYWWSNIAVPEADGTRVLAPAPMAFHHDADNKLVRGPMPMEEDFDASYATNRTFAADLYFEVPQGHRPWIASLDRDGRGLIQTSTSRLCGRKMWAWGTGAGSRRWLDLITEGQGYVEIQAGLSTIQAQYQLMPPKAQWTWLEAYGPMAADPRRAHDPDWNAAWRAVEGQLDQLLPAAQLEDELQRAESLADRAPSRILHQGSGWGALERRRRMTMDEPPIAPAVLPFPDSSLSAEQQPWLALLDDGALPYRRPAEEPGSLMVQAEWRSLLETALNHGRGDHWLSWWHVGLMRYRAGDVEGAKHAWEKSIALEPSAWAYRNLALLAADDQQEDRAIELWLAASRLAPHLLPLAVEIAQALLRFARHAQLIDFVQSLPPDLAADGRLRMMHARAALEQGDLEPSRRFFAEQVQLNNIREAELSVTDLWFVYQQHRLAKELGLTPSPELADRARREFPPPPAYDFRMLHRRG